MSQVGQRRKVRILFVEDSPCDVQLCVELLEREGLCVEHRSVTTETGLSRALREFEPDLVLCDYSIPGYSGPQALDLIVRTEPDIPVLLVSGAIDEEAALDCLNRGALDCLSKRSLSRLAPAVRRALTEVSNRQKYENTLYRLAHYDSLTGLPNATLLMDRIGSAIERARHLGRGPGLITLDLDGFSALDQGYGRLTADALLNTIGSQLCARAPSSAVVARIGADEFGILLPSTSGVAEVNKVARRLLDALSEPRIINDQEMRLTASAGVALFPADGDDAATLLSNASAAQRSVKEQTHGSCANHSGTTARINVERLRTEAALRGALERGELSMHYQPQYDAKTKRMYGVEALMRWNRTTGSEVSPSVFIPIAERTGLIGTLGAWALREACSTVLGWHAAGAPMLTLAVNVSMYQLREDFCEIVAGTLRETQFPAPYLELELTESILMDDADCARSACIRLRNMGVHIAIDDFGTGYSSLGYLTRLPLDRLKLDRSLVSGVSEEPQRLTIARAVIALGHSLGLQVLAEGIETEADLAQLVDLGCDQAQGYLFAAALPSDTLRSLLGRRVRPPMRAMRKPELNLS